MSLRVVTGALTGKPLAQIEGTVPTLAELREVSERQLPVYIAGLHDTVSSLDFLEDIEGLRVLRIENGISADLQVIGRLSALEELSLGVDANKNRLDLSALSRLESFGGSADEVILPTARLQFVKMWASDFGALVGRYQYLSTVELIAPRGAQVVLPSPEVLPSVEILRITGGQSFIINRSADAIGYTALRQVYMYSIGAVAGFRELLDQYKLDVVVLDRVRSFDAGEALFDRVGEVGLFESLAFDADFLAHAKQMPNWKVVPSKQSSPTKSGKRHAVHAWLIHPALGESIRQDDLYDGELTDSLVEWMIMYDETARMQQLRDLWADVAAWADKRGASVVRWPSVEEESDYRESQSFDVATVMNMNTREVDGVAIYAGDQLLVEVQESLEDGVIVYSSRKNEIRFKQA